MTREEQIDWLCRLRADLNNGVIFTPWNKEFTEALNDFLDQESETDGDTISRQAMLDYIDKMPSELTADGRRMIRRRTLEEYISDTLPSVQPKPKTGHWEPKYPTREEIIYCQERYFCSNCKEFVVDRISRLEFKFCPNCGCRMESEESE